MEQIQQTVYPDAAVLTEVAEAYYLGLGMEKNYHEAFRYYQKAASMGSTTAMWRLGSCYEHGHGTEVDMAEALNCYEDAADYGEPAALYRLGDLYYTGVPRLIPRDTAKAADLYISAMNAADLSGNTWILPDILIRIAGCLETGNGLDKNLADAWEYYVCAIDGYLDRADEGDTECEAALDYAETRAAAVRALLEREMQGL